MSGTASLRKQFALLLDSALTLDIERAQAQGLSFAYVESASHFDLEDQARISKAFAAAGYGSLVALSLEDFQEMPVLFKLPSDGDGLESFNDLASFYNCVLSSPDGHCFIVCSVEDYFIVCGPQDFVEQAVGQDLASARRAFEAFLRGLKLG